MLGLFYLEADDRGRFAIPEAPVGTLGVYGDPPAGVPWFLQGSSGVPVEAGKTTVVEVKAVKGVRLKGLVRERGTGRPVAEVEVGLYEASGQGLAAMPRGASSSSACRAARASLWGRSPDGLAVPPYSGHSTKVPEGVAELELKPIEMSRAGTVRGIVVDERGEPVPGATVRASWTVAPGRIERRAIAGARGEVTISGVAKEVAVELSATAPDGRRTTRAVESRAEAEPARLVLDSAGSASLAGRVVDPSGRRVAGARVRIRTERHLADGHIYGDELVEIRGAYTIKTNDTGWFRTPPILDPRLKYCALAEADGCEPARTGWVAGTARTFPELVLRPETRDRLAAIEGSVLDRRGQPVAGAAVWTTNDAGTPIRSTTDARGRLRIEQVPSRRSFLFVEAPVFRFHGRVIDPAAGPVSDRADPIRRATGGDDVDLAAGPAAGRGARAGEPADPPLRRAGRQGRRPVDASASAASPGLIRPDSRARDHRDRDPRQPRRRRLRSAWPAPGRCGRTAAPRRWP